jgi:hypothetical protein
MAQELSTFAVPGEKLLGAKRPVNAFEKAVQEQKVKCELVGDGDTTSHCRLVLTNLTSSSQKLTVPQYQFFIPQKPQSQVMMSTTQTEVDVPPGAIASVELATVCASSKIHKAPTVEAACYTPGCHPDEKLDALCRSVVSIAENLERAGDYEGVHMSKQRRQHTIAQLAIWTAFGKSTPSKEDDVSKEILRDETIDALVATNRRSLTHKERKSIDTLAGEIFAGVDLTLKLAKNESSSRFAVEAICY